MIQSRFALLLLESMPIQTKWIHLCGNISVFMAFVHLTHFSQNRVRFVPSLESNRLLSKLPVQHERKKISHAWLMFSFQPLDYDRHSLRRDGCTKMESWLSLMKREDGNKIDFTPITRDQTRRIILNFTFWLRCRKRKAFRLFIRLDVTETLLTSFLNFIHSFLLFGKSVMINVVQLIRKFLMGGEEVFSSLFCGRKKYPPKGSLFSLPKSHLEISVFRSILLSCLMEILM